MMTARRYLPLDQQIALQVEDLEQVQRQQERLILATPTGEARNALTEVNIALMCAVDRLKILRAQAEPIRL